MAVSAIMPVAVMCTVVMPFHYLAVAVTAVVMDAVVVRAALG
jgi:hypothetical protein